MKAGAAIASFTGLLLLGLGLRMIGASFDPEIMGRVEPVVIEVQADSLEEKTSWTRITGFMMMGMSVIPLGMSVLFITLEFGRNSRIPLSILCLLVGGGFGLVAFRAGLGPAASETYAALFGLGSVFLWALSGALLVPLIRSKEDAPTSAS